GSVKGGGLPAECGELARARDGDRPRRLAALCGEVHPALVQALLAAPGDLNDTRVLARLAGLQVLANRGTVTVVVGRLDQQAPGVRRPRLGDLAPGALLVRGVLPRHAAREAP